MLTEERLARADRGWTAGKRVGGGDGLAARHRARSDCNGQEDTK
jgi:hypothetical protein